MGLAFDPQKRQSMVNNAKAREFLENNQITIYFSAIGLALLIGSVLPGSSELGVVINPVLALMLFVTFLQVPLAELGCAFAHIRFISALIFTNFVAVPLLVLFLTPFFPVDPMICFGVLLVLLAPCIGYVVTFTHLGQGDARLLLAATPILLIVQMLLLPIYLGLFLGENAISLIQLGPFIHAFVWLIAIPLVFAAILQHWAARSMAGKTVSTTLGLLAVPSTGSVLFVVIASVVPQIEAAIDASLQVVPIYIVYASTAPLVGWGVSRLFRLDAPSGRAISFSAGTRNSLVVLPIAFAVHGAMSVLPAVIVTQTLVELVFELLYIRLMPALGRSD